MSIPYVVCGREDKIEEAYHHRTERAILSGCQTMDDVETVLKDIRVYVVTSSAKQFDTICNRRFDMIILFEASRLPLLRAVPSLWSAAPFIMFGDLVLDSDMESIYSHLASISMHNIVNLWEMYNCEEVIVRAARTIWGSELKCNTPHPQVSLKPLKVLARDVRHFFEDILSMEKPLIFVNTGSTDAAVMTAVAAGLIYEEVNLIAERDILPRLGSGLFNCRRNGKLVYTKYQPFMEKAAARVKAFSARAVLSQRKDVMIAVASGPDARILERSLGMTRRKLILFGRFEEVGESPLWATIIQQAEKDWIFDFPEKLLFTEPFSGKFGDIEDL